MGLDIVAGIWIAFWVYVTFYGIKYNLHSWQVFHQFYLNTLCMIAGPAQRRRLALIRKHKRELRAGKIVKKAIPAKSLRHPVPLKECVSCLSKVDGSTLTDVSGGVMLCIPCHKHIFGHDARERKVTTISKQHGIVSENEVREAKKYVHNPMSKPDGVMVLDSDWVLEHSSTPPPVNTANYFRPTPEIAKLWDVFGEVMTYDQVRNKRHEVWARLSELNDVFDKRGEFSRWQRAEFDDGTRIMHQLDVILDKMEQPARKCACGGELDRHGVCKVSC